jgi:hypothetical protein
MTSNKLSALSRYVSVSIRHTQLQTASWLQAVSKTGFNSSIQVYVTILSSTASLQGWKVFCNKWVCNAVEKYLGRKNVWRYNELRIKHEWILHKERRCDVLGVPGAVKVLTWRTLSWAEHAPRKNTTETIIVWFRKVTWLFIGNGMRKVTMGFVCR